MVPDRDPEVDAVEERARARLDQTIREIFDCIDDGARIVEMGWERLDTDWLVRRAARNVIAELGETVKRLPQSYLDDHPDIEWRAIAGMRDRTVHQHTDYFVVWATLTVDFPRLREALTDSDQGA